MEMLLSTLAFVFLGLAELTTHHVLVISETYPIPTAPELHEFNFEKEEKTSCGDKITVRDSKGRMAVFRYEKSKLIKVVHNVGTKDAEGWLDTDRDGRLDRYYRGQAEAGLLLADFLNACGAHTQTKEGS